MSRAKNSKFILLHYCVRANIFELEEGPAACGANPPAHKRLRTGGQPFKDLRHTQRDILFSGWVSLKSLRGYPPARKRLWAGGVAPQAAGPPSSSQTFFRAQECSNMSFESLACSAPARNWLRAGWEAAARGHGGPGAQTLARWSGSFF